MIKPILMIHHVKDWMFDLPLENFILTFDDGYHDHWNTFPRFLEIPTDKIYFITGSWINRPGFLTVDQIKKMDQHDDVEIGAHGFDHQKIISPDSGDPGLANSRAEIISMLTIDTQKTVEWFQENLGTVLKKFCYPYNESVFGIYPQILRKYGFDEFYGPGRVKIEWLVDPVRHRQHNNSEKNRTWLLES
jgi:peptidoglycan/xylan/chitin deacetylase (PgdA/CDA1 family)